MKIHRHHPETCTASLKLLGDYWTLRIIDVLKDGKYRRYCEIQRQADNLNPVTLSNRLKKLENAKLIKRIEDVEDKVSVSYGLTRTGHKALPVIDAVNKFSLKS